jgi:hypothetical protein
MIGRNGKGGVSPPPATARHQAPGQIGRYHGPADPSKAVRFIVDGQPITFRGKRAAMLQALMVAGSEGVAHVETLPWLLNPGDAVKAFRAKCIHIDTRPGKPSRWILRSQVRELKQ